MKPVILKNRTDLISAIYNDEILPTAVFVNKTKGCCTNPSTAHGFRVGNESTMDNFLEGVKNYGNKGEELEVHLFPFYEHSGQGNEIDYATHWGTNGGLTPYIRDCEHYATKAFADCA